MDVIEPNKDERLDQDYGTAFGLEEGGELGIASAAKNTWEDFKTLDYRFLLPISKVFSSRLLRRRAVRWVLLFGLLPLFFFEIHQWFGLTFEQTIWLIEAYFCLFWALYFYSVIRPSSTVWKRAIGYALFTAFIGIPILLFVQGFPIVRDLYAGTDSYNFYGRVLGYVLGVGLFEEVCKALPLLWFGLRSKKITNIRDGVFLGLMSGFGFAAAEGVRYTVQATAYAHMYGTISEQFMQFMFRIMSGPILHGAWAGTVGWFIGVAALKSGKKWPIVAVGIGCMAFLHGMYDVFAGSIWGIGIAALSFIILMAYLTHGEEQERINQASMVNNDSPNEAGGTTSDLAPARNDSEAKAAEEDVTTANRDAKNVVDPQPLDEAELDRDATG